MIYFFEGNEQFLITEEENKLIKKYEIIPENIIHYQALETNFSTISLEICSNDIFGKQKCIVLNNVQLLNEKELSETLTETLLDTMQSSDNILILQYRREEVLTKTSEKALAHLFSYAKRINVRQKNEQQVIKQIEKELSHFEHNLEFQDMKYLAEKYKNDLSLIVQQIQQVGAYAAQSGKTIQAEAFFDASSDFIEEQVFDLMRYVETNNPQKGFHLLENLFLHQQNIFGLLALLIKNYKEMYQIATLKAVGYSFQQISKRLGIHEYRTKKLWESSKGIKKSDYPFILDKLINAEIELKRGKDPLTVMKSQLAYIFNHQ